MEATEIRLEFDPEKALIPPDGGPFGNMTVRRVGGAVVGAGILLLASPFYWSFLTGPAILMDDPVGAALGFRRPGNTLLLVGSIYVAMGLAGVSVTRLRRPAVETLALGAVGALVLSRLVAWFASVPSTTGPTTLGAGPTNFVVALWPIALGAVAGAAGHTRRRAAVLLVAALAVLQLYAVLLANVWPIRSQPMPGFFVLGIIIVVLVYDAVFAMPLYRYGRLLGRGDGDQ